MTYAHARVYAAEQSRAIGGDRGTSAHAWGERASQGGRRSVNGGLALGSNYVRTASEWLLPRGRRLAVTRQA